MSGMDLLRERIAGAIRPHLVAENYRAGDMADAVIATLGIAEVATIAWDGEPSMSGEPHRMSLGVDHDPEKLKRAIIEVGSSVKYKPGARIERRYVTPWERIEEDA